MYISLCKKMVKLYDNPKIPFEKYFKTILEPPCLNKMDGGRTFYMTAYWRMCNAQSLTFSLQYCMHHLFLFIDESNCKLSDELLIPIIKLIAMYVVVWITWWLVLGSFYYHLTFAIQGTRIYLMSNSFIVLLLQSKFLGILQRQMIKPFSIVF